jgi:hypothetical protein
MINSRIILVSINIFDQSLQPFSQESIIVSSKPDINSSPIINAFAASDDTRLKKKKKQQQQQQKMNLRALKSLEFSKFISTKKLKSEKEKGLRGDFIRLSVC